jgi:hypothetical protein
MAKRYRDPVLRKLVLLGILIFIVNSAADTYYEGDYLRLFITEGPADIIRWVSASDTGQIITDDQRSAP